MESCEINKKILEKLFFKFLGVALQICTGVRISLKW